MCTRGSVTLSITLDRHARGDAGTKSWEELVSDGWSMWVTEAKEKNFDTDSPEEKNSWALGFMICWMDHETVVQSLETSAIPTLRPCANNEMRKKRKRVDVERHRPLLGLRGKLTARAPQSTGDIQQEQAQ